MKERAKIFFNDWEIILSANYCHKVADGTHDTPKPLDEGKKLITSTHLKEGRINIADAYSISENDFVSINRRSKVDKWDVLFSMIGTVGEIVLVKEEPDFAIKNLGLFKTKNETDGWWLYYYLSSKIGQAIIDTYSSGSSQRFVSLGDLRKLPILNPPDDYKKSVINILKCYDDLIENSNKRIALLEQMAEQIYKEWFVRMRFPGYENSEFEKGVPKGWEVTYFRDFIKLNRGFDLPDEKIIEGNYPVIASTSIKAFHNQYKVEAPCITTGRSGSLGTVQYVNNKSWPLNTSLYVKDFKGNSPRFVFYFLKSIKLENFNSGAGVPTLNQNHLHTLKFYLPSKSLQKSFDQLIIPIFNQVENLKSQVNILKQTRDLLLLRLISGKLKVKEIKEEQLSKVEI